jgi:hypothetical protein
MRNYWIIVAFVFGNVFQTYAQESLYQYEPSGEHPFGLPNPKVPEQIKDFETMIGE